MYQTQPLTQDMHRDRDGCLEQDTEWEDDNGDPRRPGTLAVDTNSDARRVPGSRVVEGGKRGVGAAGGAGSLVVFNVNVDEFPIP